MHVARSGLLALALALLPLLPASAALQPDRRGVVAPDRNFDLLELDLDLEVDPAGTVAGTASLRVKRLWPGPLVLDQVGLQIEAVEVGDTSPRWWVEGEKLLVELAQDEATVRIRYRARPRLGLHFRKAEKGGPDRYDEVWSQGEAEDNRYWFPTWDHPNDRFLYQGRIRAPEGLTVITNSGQELVSYLVMVAAGPYELFVHPEDPRIRSYLPPGTPESVARRMTEPLLPMMKLMGERTGLAYPYDQYRQVFVQRFLFSGMENTTATIMGDHLLVEDVVAETRPFPETVLAHELAHHWFGDWLTCRTWRELWLNEGFATFMAAEWKRSQEGEDAHAESVERWEAHAISERAMARRFHQGADGPDSSHVYVRGAMVLHMLRVMLGEDRFWAGVKRYVAENGPGLVETADLQRAMEDVSGRHLDWFFQQWVELPGGPVLSISRRFREGRFSVTIRQEPGKNGFLYTLPVEVEVGLNDGSTKTLSGWLEDEDLELSLELAEAPLYAAFDPRGGILARELKDEQDPAGWAAQLRQSRSSHARRAAVRALGETDKSEALAEILAEEGQPLPLRIAAAKALGEQRAVAPLLPALEARHGALRLAAAKALGRATGDEAGRALLGALRRDRNPDVRAEALQSLARIRPAWAVEEARTLTRLAGPGEDHLRGISLEVLGAHGSPGDLGLLLDERAPGRFGQQGLAAAVRLVSRQEPGRQRDRMAGQTARFGERLLLDRDYRGRESALALLGEVGDEATIPLLERYRREETVPRLKDAAREAIRLIEGRKEAPPESPNELEARLEEIETRLKELEEQRQRWEDRR